MESRSPRLAPLGRLDRDIAERLGRPKPRGPISREVDCDGNQDHERRQWAGAHTIGRERRAPARHPSRAVNHRAIGSSADMDQALCHRDLGSAAVWDWLRRRSARIGGEIRGNLRDQRAVNDPGGAVDDAHDHSVAPLLGRVRGAPVTPIRFYLSGDRNPNSPASATDTAMGRLRADRKRLSTSGIVPSAESVPEASSLTLLRTALLLVAVFRRVAVIHGLAHINPSRAQHKLQGPRA